MLVRVTPGVEAHTHEYIATGADDSKFGFTVSNGSARDAALRVAKSDAMELRRLPLPHRVADPRARVVRPCRGRRRGAAADVARATGAPVPEINLGGGLGVPYTADDLDAPSIAEFGRETRANFADACATFDLDPAPALTVEAGRSIAAPAGVTLYTVGTIKEIPGVRTYVAVDGGMSDNPRPATYGAALRGRAPGADHRPPAVRRHRRRQALRAG